jgi:hypothetical protein
MNTKSYRFLRRLPNGSTFVLGTAVEYTEWLGAPGGWRFFPNVVTRRPSLKRHATLEKCLPRWVGYPDHCESERVT